MLTLCGFTLGVTLLIYTFVNIKIKEIYLQKIRSIKPYSGRVLMA